MNRRGVENFAKLAAAQRAVLFPADILFRGTPLVCAMSAVRTRRQLEEAGFEYEHSAILRFQRAVLPALPELGEVVKVIATGKTYEIAEVINAPHAAEIVVGLAEQ